MLDKDQTEFGKTTLMKNRSHSSNASMINYLRSWTMSMTLIGEERASLKGTGPECGHEGL
jgi:hypothetical protein